MEVVTCKSCGRLFNYLSGPRICPACQKKIEEKFVEVKKYVREHPDIDIKTLSKELAEKYPVVPELFEGKNVEQNHELTPEEREAIGKYVQMICKMHDIIEWEHYIRGHRDSMLLMKRCGFWG